MTTPSRLRAVVASQPAAHQAATEALARGNAVDAVVTAVFAAAAVSPGVLLGPVQLLVGGAGIGLRAVDGRARQPGIGSVRPRGFVEGTSIPDAARVATPLLPAALAAVLASAGTTTMSRVVAPGIELARALSKPRAELLKMIARLGPSALASDTVREELVAVAGRVVGGLLGPGDLATLMPTVETAHETRLGARTLVTVPWGSLAVRDENAASIESGDVQIVAASDGRGTIAIACYEAPMGGLDVPELGIVAPRLANPVRRGVEREKPGAPLQAAAPMALLELEGYCDYAFGVRGLQGETDTGAIARKIAADAGIEQAAGGIRGLLAVARTKDAARPIVI